MPETITYHRTGEFRPPKKDEWYETFRGPIRDKGGSIFCGVDEPHEDP